MSFHLCGDDPTQSDMYSGDGEDSEETTGLGTVEGVLSCGRGTSEEEVFLALTRVSKLVLEGRDG